MSVSSFMIAALVGLTEASLSSGLSGFRDKASEWVLAGEDLPANYRTQLYEMSSEDRLQAIVFLRRSGLLRGDIWTLEDVLRETDETGGAHR